MIGRLKGVIDSVDDVAVVDVGGVGYEVHMASRDLAQLAPGDAVTLIIETVVREDMIRLYGFREASARDWFRLLQGVQGVGAKVALAVLSVLPPDDLASAIVSENKTAITRAPGVGKRVAERIVGELKTKLPQTVAPVVIDAAPLAANPANDTVADAVSALVNLGYDEMRARDAVQRIALATPDAEAAALIRGGLKALAA